jgi:glycine cleavage system aminomethyltransferase T
MSILTCKISAAGLLIRAISDEVHVEKTGNAAFLNYLVLTNNVAKLADGQAQYTAILLCNEQAGLWAI